MGEPHYHTVRCECGSPILTLVAGEHTAAMRCPSCQDFTPCRHCGKRLRRPVCARFGGKVHRSTRSAAESYQGPA